jgi:hypothetical protein
VSIGLEFKRLLLDRYRALFYNIYSIGLKYTVIIYKDPVDIIAFISNKVFLYYLIFLWLFLVLLTSYKPDTESDNIEVVNE